MTPTSAEKKDNMRVLKLFLAACAIALPMAAYAQAPATDVAFVGVNVIPMDSERVLQDQTVIVRNGRIEQIGPSAQVSVPDSATRIDGRGKFLLPGLADMHIHVSPGQGNPNDAAFNQMTVLLANGITTARGMAGNPNNFRVRERIQSGQLLGPMLYLASPGLQGSNVPHVEAAQAMVESFKKDGYDMLKIFNITRTNYAAAVETARRVGLPVVGHVPAGVMLQQALSSQITIEHLDAYLPALTRDDAPVKDVDSQFAPGEILNYLDESKLPALAAATRQSGAFNTPTLHFAALIVSDATGEQLRAHYQEELKYVPQQARTQWTNQRGNQLKDAPPADQRARFVDIRKKLTKALYTGGAKLLAGSDSPQLFNVHGFALHRELAALVDAGLSTYAALETATRNPAEYLKGDFGVVATGKRADLLLLHANPLQSIGNLQSAAA